MKKLWSLGKELWTDRNYQMHYNNSNEEYVKIGQTSALLLQ
jgi:hypothetical protein